ncbi:hypothetical protein BDK51DRAFT_44987 [Blyttiomyces helicus]|uniref:Uncharacterized protein n=1 Tax=Blyttiomyces helicus TaxID=388810 RepID=A0A4P9W473_9FUNG|nr:hypothetical protein BDK51DRAFT_44987 [Blyttiomyces helicus]|eukprot:RKO87141.1 hypothetical protein BDK51DRAFT_44987 [Blyttiomyces helicus]
MSSVFVKLNQQERDVRPNGGGPIRGRTPRPGSPGRQRPTATPIRPRPSVPSSSISGPVGDFHTEFASGPPGTHTRGENAIIALIQDFRAEMRHFQVEVRRDLDAMRALVESQVVKKWTPSASEKKNLREAAIKSTLSPRAIYSNSQAATVVNYAIKMELVDGKLIKEPAVREGLIAIAANELIQARSQLKKRIYSKKVPVDAPETVSRICSEPLAAFAAIIFNTRKLTEWHLERAAFLRSMSLKLERAGQRKSKSFWVDINDQMKTIKKMNEEEQAAYWTSVLAEEAANFGDTSMKLLHDVNEPQDDDEEDDGVPFDDALVDEHASDEEAEKSHARKEVEVEASSAEPAPLGATPLVHPREGGGEAPLFSWEHVEVQV